MKNTCRMKRTDDEDRNTLIRRSPGWRSAALNKLIAKLDCKYLKKKKDSSKPAKKRIDGTLSNRTPPSNAPRWALVSTSDSTIANDDASTSDLNGDIMDSGESNPTSIINSDSINNQTGATNSGESNSINSSPSSNNTTDDHDDELESEDEDLNEIFQAVNGTH